MGDLEPRGRAEICVRADGLSGEFEIHDSAGLDEFMRRLACCGTAAFADYAGPDEPEEPAPKKPRKAMSLKPSAPGSFDGRLLRKIREIGEDKGALATAMDSTVGVVGTAIARLRKKGEL